MSQTEESSVRQVIDRYVRGYLAADPEQISQAFHADTRLLSTDAGQLETTHLPAWLESLSARRARGDVRTGDYEIAFVDVREDTAVARIALRLPQQQLQFTDYLSFLKLGSEWKIVGKIYSAIKSPQAG